MSHVIVGRRPIASGTEQASSPLVTPSRSAVRLSLLVAALVVVAATAGLIWEGGGGPSTVETVRGETVDLYATGLYRYDSVFKGAGNRGTDVVVLTLGVSLLVAAAASYRRQTIEGALLLTGALAWLLYVYATMSIGTAYNEFFLVYVTIFGASVWALVHTVRSFNLGVWSASLTTALPRRTLAWFLIGAGAFTAFMWAAPIVATLMAGEAPPLLAHTTTLVTEALDLALIVPATLTAAWCLLRGREAVGYVLAVPLLVLLVALAPTIAAQTISQMQAGVAFTTAEFIGPISGFVVLGTFALVLAAKILRRAGGDLRRVRSTQ